MEKVTFKLRCWIAGTALFLLGSTTACTTDDSDPAEEETGGSGGASGGGGTSGTGGSTGGSSGTGGMATKCANPITLASSASAIANFDNYMGDPVDLATLQTWSFPLGGDSASGVYSGTFIYGDDHMEGGKEVPEASAMVEGNASSVYALSISDTSAEDYGGGMGLWLSACLDATAFSGISFWVRGNAPNGGQATLKLLMEETTSSVPSSSTDAIGTCEGTDDGDAATCKPPTATFAVTDTWTEVELPWSSFTGAASPGKTVTVDGHDIWQIQYDIGLLWADDGTGTYVPTVAPYELVVDDLTFY
jgi:hypothetical protein